MSLSWNEVRDRAIRFAREWASSTDEERDMQPRGESSFASA